MFKAAEKRAAGKVDTLGDGIVDVFKPFYQTLKVVLKQLEDYAAREFRYE